MKIAAFVLATFFVSCVAVRQSKGGFSMRPEMVQHASEGVGMQRYVDITVNNPWPVPLDAVILCEDTTGDGGVDETPISISPLDMMEIRIGFWSRGIYLCKIAEE